MIKIDIDCSIILIERKDIKEGIKALRKRSRIAVLTNGIYRLYNKDGVLLYIGRGKKVLNRVIDHMTGKSLNTRHFFEEIEHAEILILPSCSRGRIESLEQYLIKVFNPKYNELKWSDYTIMNLIKDFEV
ncbi:GIY-YIG nuclease family protein [Bacillus sp. 165]|uniref:GIY-YIG nuclease family protein n=1 Tax=Bacillus sp. 165 TaxID=1529117 RepID=UPI001ADB9C8D|nr:GIY-YIG nuclease family protein [Bacillus sp. 165]MBO9131425.1 GIY-YIG nuclease family protein [Bacillus sp. 165]